MRSNIVSNGSVGAISTKGSEMFIFSSPCSGNEVKCGVELCHSTFNGSSIRRKLENESKLVRNTPPQYNMWV